MRHGRQHRPSMRNNRDECLRDRQDASRSNGYVPNANVSVVRENETREQDQEIPHGQAGPAAGRSRTSPNAVRTMGFEREQLGRLGLRADERRAIGAGAEFGRTWFFSHGLRETDAGA